MSIAGMGKSVLRCLRMLLIDLRNDESLSWLLRALICPSFIRSHVFSVLQHYSSSATEPAAMAFLRQSGKAKLISSPR